LLGPFFHPEDGGNMFLQNGWFSLFYFILNEAIITMIKSRRMRWAGHVTRMEQRGMHVEYWWESEKERDH
jgi:hypothetical protein